MGRGQRGCRITAFGIMRPCVYRTVTRRRDSHLASACWRHGATRSRPCIVSTSVQSCWTRRRSAPLVKKKYIACNGPLRRRCQGDSIAPTERPLQKIKGGDTLLASPPFGFIIGVMRHASCVMRHASCVMRHASCVQFNCPCSSITSTVRSGFNGSISVLASLYTRGVW